MTQPLIHNPSNAEATFIQSTALTELSQMSTYVPGFESFFRFFASFCNAKISHHQHTV